MSEWTKITPAATEAVSQSRKRKRVHHEALSAHHGYYYEIGRTLFKGRSDFQSVELVETPRFGHVLLIDGITQIFESAEFQYHEPIVHPALCSHPNPRHVLVIGAGDGGVLREVVRYPQLSSIDMVELDGKVLDIARKHLVRVHGGAFDDPRVNLFVEDGRKFVAQTKGKYDVIIMDMTDPQGPSALLYTREFFREVKRALRDDRGLFAMHAESPDDRPIAFSSIIKTNRAVFASVTPFYHFVQQYASNWCFVVSGMQDRAAKIKRSNIDQRLNRNGIKGLKLYTGAVHEAMRVSRPYINTILRNKAPIITDARPDFPDQFEELPFD